MLVTTTHVVTTTLTRPIPHRLDVLAVGSVLTGIGLLVVGATTAVSSLRQARTAKTKLQLDLYERRHAVYVGTRQFLSVLTTKSAPSWDDTSTFLTAIAEASFLFGPEIQAYLGIYCEIGDRRQGVAPLPGAGPLGLQDNDDGQWIREQYRDIEGTFAPYLRISERFH